MKFKNDDPFAVGFPMTWHEIADIKYWGKTDSKNIVAHLKSWNLDGSGLWLWKVRNFGKPDSEWTKQEKIYMFPKDGDKLIQELASLSLGHTIVLLTYQNYDHNIYVGESQDGQTNIDAEVLDELSLAFKRR